VFAMNKYTKEIKKKLENACTTQYSGTFMPLLPLNFKNNFCLITSKISNLWKNCTGHKIHILFTTFLQNNFPSNKYAASYIGGMWKNACRSHLTCVSD
jgi:hypothetical protein